MVYPAAKDAPKFREEASQAFFFVESLLPSLEMVFWGNGNRLEERKAMEEEQRVLLREREEKE